MNMYLTRLGGTSARELGPAGCEARRHHATCHATIGATIAALYRRKGGGLPSRENMHNGM